MGSEELPATSRADGICDCFQILSIETKAPREARSLAVARPMPDAAPVIATTRLRNIVWDCGK
jgi:hypothetical protein